MWIGNETLREAIVELRDATQAMRKVANGASVKGSDIANLVITPPPLRTFHVYRQHQKAPVLVRAHKACALSSSEVWFDRDGRTVACFDDVAYWVEKVEEKPAFLRKIMD